MFSGKFREYNRIRADFDHAKEVIFDDRRAAIPIHPMVRYAIWPQTNSPPAATNQHAAVQMMFC